MSARSFSVPLATLALSTTVTASCSSGGLIGQWMMTEWESYGSDYSSSLEATSYTTDDGCTYTRHDTLWLEFDDRDGRTYTGQYAQGTPPSRASRAGSRVPSATATPSRPTSGSRAGTRS